MTIAVVVESTWQAAALSPWAARLARGREAKRVLFLVTTSNKGKKKAESRKAAAAAAAKKPAAAAVKEKVTEAAGAVKDAVEDAVEAVEDATGTSEPADAGKAEPAAGAADADAEKSAADREPRSPLEAAVRDAVASAGLVCGGDAGDGPAVVVRPVEIAPGDSGDAEAGLEDLLAALDEHDTGLLLLAASETRRNDEPLTARLFRSVRCPVVIVRPPPGRSAKDEPGDPAPSAVDGRVLVPTAGGPHAALALRLAAGLERTEGITGVDALYVQKDVGYESRGLAQRKVRGNVRRAMGGPLAMPTMRSESIGEVIRVGESYPDALASVLGEGRHGVVMVGAADRVQAKRALYGGLPDELLRDNDGDGDGGGRGITLVVVREAEALTDAAGRVARNFVQRWVPQLDREARISLVERIEGPSRWSFDFVTLMILSTAIATFGEMQDSTAVVIGAMLVAPLMTPLVGCGLAVVQGNNRLVKGSVNSVALGFLVAFGVALLMGLLIPYPGLTSEVLARGRPTLLDLGVAFVSGLAAAYAVARPNLSGALPGVAIAAALVPPIAAAGLAFSAGDWRVGGGASLLFFVNVLAIILGAAMALAAVGVEGSHEHKRGGHWRPHAFGGLAIGCGLLAIPLTWSLLQAMPPEGLPPRVEASLGEAVAEDGGSQLVSAEGPFPSEDGGLRIEVRRRGALPPRAGLADELAAELAEHYGDAVTVNVTTELTQASGQSGTAE